MLAYWSQKDNTQNKNPVNGDTENYKGYIREGGKGRDNELH